MKGSEIDVKENTMNHYVPEKINRTFNDKCIGYKSIGDVNTSIYYYLGKDQTMTDDLRASGERKIYLTMKTNFMSSKDSDESRCILTVITQNVSLVIIQTKLLMSFLVHFLIENEWIYKH